MNIEQLEYIIKVAETRSISNSSESLHVSQAGISMAITSLEKELGIKIFKRSRTGTVPTEEGREIIKTAYEVVNKLQEIREKAQTHVDIMEKELSLSATQGLFLSILPKALALFKQKYPDVNIIIEEKRGHCVIDDVKNNKVDLGLMQIPKKKPMEQELEFRTLLQTKIAITVSKYSPLASRKSISLEEVIDQDLVVYNGPDMQYFIKYLFQHYGKMNVLFSTNNTEIMKKTVAEDLAIAFSYDFGINHDPYYLSGELVSVPLLNLKHDTLELGWIRSSKHRLSKATKEFIKCLELLTSPYKN
ncbi:LysR family transcriptional regulator [Sporosarcina obsidiansis]|uniref:LysR family transcriptional regulator n=1 Tax=Sporosarcina obsidiansis TaxID=2660748 RepID=UPI00129A254E|nr:LysR family transcriptional regulator [Sporosarcina obsidiansis]